MPIKGTRPIGEDVDDAKDAAEHVMIVDLERNDLSRVCRVGSVRWPKLMVQRELAGVTHLVSTVEGRLLPGVGLAEILRATFPGGSITGAPKIAAIDHIARLEPVGRGAAMGALGTIHANGDFELALTIRTFAVADGRIHLWVGGGIVWDSEPEAEIEESWVKARPLLAAVGSQGRGLTLLAVAVAGRGLVDPEAAVFRADDEALLRGSVAFETVRTYRGAPFLLDRHLRRFNFSIDALALPAADGVEELVELVIGVAPPDHVLRLYRTDQQLVATVAGLPDNLEDLRRRGLALQSVDIGAPAPLLAGAKTTSYGEAFAARRLAEREGADEALLVADGLVLEAATANIWWRSGDELRTPAARPGVLPGVTRELVLELEAATEGVFPLTDLEQADEAFITSSIREVMPVVALDGKRVGDGVPGPAAARLQAALRLRSQG